jgi:hypothetical protein
MDLPPIPIATKKRKQQLFMWPGGFITEPGAGGVPVGGDGSMNFSDEDASALIVLLEDI